MGGATVSSSKHVEHSASLNSLPVALPFQRDVTPMTSATPCSSVGRSTSLPSVIMSTASRRKPAVACLDPPVRFYSGSLRHQDSILLRKSKLRRVQLRPSGHGLPAEGLGVKKVAVQVIDTPSDDSTGDDFDGSSEPSGMSPNRDMSDVDPDHISVISTWTAGARLPEFGEQNCRDPAPSRLVRRRQCCTNDEARSIINSTNKLTVILSAVDLPYHVSRSALRCECRAVLDVRNLSRSERQRREVTEYLHVQPRSRSDGRQYPAGMWSRKPEPDEKYHPAAELRSSSPSPERFPGENSTSGYYGSQLSDAPVAVTSERRVYALARAYSDRVRKLQRTSTTTHHAENFDVAANFRVPVHRARARSVSAGRRTALPLSPIAFYT